MTIEIDDEIIFQALFEMFPQSELQNRKNSINLTAFKNYLINPRKNLIFAADLKLKYEELLYKQKLNEIISDK